MSWGDIFFGFRGRINRKVYWAGSVAVGVAGFLFAALLAYLATGNPLAPEVWGETSRTSAPDGVPSGSPISVSLSGPPPRSP